MSIKKEIIQKYNEFSDFLETVDVDRLKQEMTREELNLFKSELYKIKIRSLPYDIGKLAEEMKLEEHPELLDVHKYPELKEINFLSNDEKIELDKFLGSLMPNRHYINGLIGVVEDYRKIDDVKNFLLQKGIVERRHFLNCPKCNDNYLSRTLTDNDKLRLEQILDKKDWDDYEELEELMHFTCDECFYEYPDPFEINNLYFTTEHILVKERDTKLDNI